MLIGTTGSDNVLCVRAKGNDSFWVDGNQFHKFPRKAGVYLTCRNAPIVQVELVSGYLDCLLKFQELIFLGT